MRFIEQAAFTKRFTQCPSQLFGVWRLSFSRPNSLVAELLNDRPFDWLLRKVGKQSRGRADLLGGRERIGRGDQTEGEARLQRNHFEFYRIAALDIAGQSHLEGLTGDLHLEQPLAYFVLDKPLHLLSRFKIGDGLGCLGSSGD